MIPPGQTWAILIRKLVSFPGRPSLCASFLPLHLLMHSHIVNAVLWRSLTTVVPSSGEEVNVQPTWKKTHLFSAQLLGILLYIIVGLLVWSSWEDSHRSTQLSCCLLPVVIAYNYKGGLSEEKMNWVLKNQ